MTRLLNSGRSVALLALGAALGAIIITCARPPADPNHTARPNPVAALLSPNPAFAKALSSGADVSLADVAERVVPGVVNISATKLVRRPHNPLYNDPFFREFFGNGPAVPRDRRERSLGSGVIVSADGLVVTNNHVIEQADEMAVTLSDGREFQAKLVGADPKSDVAVIRLQGKVSGLSPVALGNSDAMRLGDVVLAVGNPFGVGQTVTMGIVSAKGRGEMGIVDYEDFIQTDAAINPGNSGGALINMRGELIGINTAIVSRTGGYQGVGFAIPSNMAKPIMDSLLSNGKVVRGWLGVGIQDLSPDLAAGLGVSASRGVVISSVSTGSPASKAGLQPSDVVVKVDGEQVDSSARLRNLIASKGTDKEITLEIVRGTKRLNIPVTLGALPGDAQAGAGESGPQATADREITVTELTPALRSRFDLPADVKGVVVSGVAADSGAAEAGIRPGDVIVQVAHKPVTTPAEYEAAYKKAGDKVLLLVQRGTFTRYVVLKKPRD
jgi:serine protease Do